MGAGLSIRNDSPLPLQVILSQLTPLHWNDRPLFTGETWNARNESNVGQVWFTASVDVFDDAAVPSRAGVAARGRRATELKADDPAAAAPPRYHPPARGRGAC